MRKYIFFIISVLCIGCQDSYSPKPKALLRLEYPQAQYDTLVGDCNFYFLKNKDSKAVEKKDKCNFDLVYPNMGATVYITYKKVDNNLKNLLKDAQKLTYEHTIKANNILEQPYLDTINKVYGMFYEVNGNAASQSQFYVTDSTNNFLTGSIYFNVKPNFDSVQPAATYLKKDIRVIMETIRWKTIKKKK